MLITKSVKDDITFGKFKDAFTAPTTVVGTAYDTSGNGGRKLVRLSNGWIVAAVSDFSTNIWFYKSVDNGTTWTQLCFTSITNVNPSFAIASSGNNIFILLSYGNVVYSIKIDGATVTNIDLNSTKVTVDTQTTVVTLSSTLAIDGTGALHAAWASKNNTRPDSFNIRYSKSTDGGATWATPTQITTMNTPNYNSQNPCIVVLSNNYPIIICEENNGGNPYRIVAKRWTGTAWNSTLDVVYDAGAYGQFSPCVAVDSNDVIHAAWQGGDSTQAAHDIRYSKSTNGGVTWAAAINLSNDNFSQENPSITIDNSNKVYVLWNGQDATSYKNIKRIIWSGSAWGAIIKLTNNTTNHAQTPNALWSKFNMNSDDAVRWIYQDVQAAAVQYDASPRPKVPDTSPVVPEIYIPLWWFSGTNATCNDSANPNGGTNDLLIKGQIPYGGSAYANSKLHTMNSAWPSNTKFAFEVTISSSGTNTSMAALWDFTVGAYISASKLTTTSTTPTVMRSGQFTLTPGRQYGVTFSTSASSTNAQITDASLIVFPS